MKPPLALLLLFSILVAPAQLSAREQREPRIPIGTRIPVWEETQSEVQLNGTRVLYEFADCIVKRKPADVRAVLATQPDSAAQEKAVRKLLGKWSNCLTQAAEMRLISFLFRGAIAEELYKAQIPVPPVLHPIPMAETYSSLTTRLAAASATPVDDKQKSTIAGRWVAYCSVHENPASVDRMVRTIPGSDAEVAALRELRPTVSGCLFQNQRAEFTRLTMRTLLAEALYQFYFQRAGTA